MSSGRLSPEDAAAEKEAASRQPKRRAVKREDALTAFNSSVEQAKAEGAELPSLFTAPRELTHVPGMRLTTQRQRDTFFRRVAKPQYRHGPPEAPWQRKVGVASWVLCGCATVACVLFLDVGERDHCFTPIRRWLGVDNFHPFRLSREDLDWAQRKKAER